MWSEPEVFFKEAFFAIFRKSAKMLVLSFKKGGEIKMLNEVLASQAEGGDQIEKPAVQRLEDGTVVIQIDSAPLGDWEREGGSANWVSPSNYSLAWRR